jgi:type I restriction-modification system DNA methylase subunit
LPEAPELVKELVEKFENNLSAYKNSDYKEEQLKQEFINPFFQALGWDVNNRSGAAPQYRDVIFEDSIKIAGGTKAPDYCFTLAGRRMFFVEAKKPAVNVDRDKRFSYQLRRYAWSAKLPLSILTDFEEFAVYESRTRPKKDEKASTGRILYFTYKDYVERWDEIYNIFSKDAVLKGSFDRYAESTKKKRGTSEVDDAFLSEIENWRELFAKNIALRNPEISIEELNFSVQKIIDRLIFLRMCEDRGAEPYEQLRDLIGKEGIYLNFCELCKKADEKYNSGLFHFQEEKGRDTPPDELTLNLKIDDGIFKTIIKDLYYPNSPYEFSVLSPEILGNVYEQFLGKVIRLTKGHQAKVEEKPEVKKAGGVYYTPQFIVDYIVKNTIGGLCKGKTPNKVSKLKILDPACGSGSFLLGAYTYLLKWHRDYYTEQKDKKRLKDKIYQGKGGEWFLTIKEKKRILLNNIHGVDIDPQAVEVTKLSLLLKVLEGENKDALEAQQKLFRERALPDLGNNIKCGNSLIGTEIYNEMDLKTEDTQRINPFNWNTEFKEIMANGGFDAVIGNPPYIRIQAMKEWAPLEVEFYKKTYLSATKGNYDIYVVFVEKGLNLLNPEGLLGFILPHKFFNAKYGEPLRSLIAEGKNLHKIVHFGDQQIFARAKTYTNLLFLNKSPNKKFKFIKVENLDNWRISGESINGFIDLEKVTGDEWNFIVGPGADLFEKMIEMPIKLGTISKMFVGLQTSADTVLLFKDSELSRGSQTTVYSKELSESVELESKLLKQVIRSGNIGRYNATPTALVLFPYEEIEGQFRLIPEKTLKKDYPKTWKYLIKNKKLLSEREHGKFKENGWYQLYPKNLDVWESPKIMLPYMITRLSAFYDTNNYYFVNVTTGGFGITVNESYGAPEYITGLLNSRLLDWFIKKVSTTFHGGYFAANKQFLVQLPIPILNFDDPEDVIKHDKMVKLVEKMLELNQKLSKTKLPNEKELIQRQIAATDNQIDKLVYELYGLTDDEIKIVKDSLK